MSYSDFHFWEFVIWDGIWHYSTKHPVWHNSGGDCGGASGSFISCQLELTRTKEFWGVGHVLIKINGWKNRVLGCRTRFDQNK